MILFGCYEQPPFRLEYVSVDSKSTLIEQREHALRVRIARGSVRQRHFENGFVVCSLECGYCRVSLVFGRFHCRSEK